MERYLLDVQKLSYEFIGLLAEAFGLPSDALAQFYDRDELMQHRGKIVQYPQTDSESQGVGPHYDAGFLTFVRPHTPLINGRFTPTSHIQLLQASDHKGLQVQNLSGDWIDVPPIPGTFVVNIGRGASMLLPVPCL
jgi:isopenicillin N synthase-like dioxygenase